MHINILNKFIYIYQITIIQSNSLWVISQQNWLFTLLQWKTNYDKRLNQINPSYAHLFPPGLCRHNAKPLLLSEGTIVKSQNNRNINAYTHILIQNLHNLTAPSKYMVSSHCHLGSRQHLNKLNRKCQVWSLPCPYMLLLQLTENPEQRIISVHTYIFSGEIYAHTTQSITI